MWHKLALLACLGLCASAQDAISNATSGPWTAELNGVWRWHNGDDLRWAAAALDDSQWARLTLPGTPPNALRYWIRIPVLLGRASDPSVLVGPIAYAYEAYWDGQRIGSLGKGPPSAVWFAVRSLVFHIPVRFAEAGLHVIAIRVFDSRPRGLWTRPVNISPLENRVGSFSALTEASAAEQKALLVRHSLSIFINLVLILMGVYFLSFPPLIAGGSAFRWFGTWLLARGLFAVCLEYFNLGPPLSPAGILGPIGGIFFGFSCIFAIEFAYAMFRRRVPLAVRCVQAANVVVVLLQVVYQELAAEKVLFGVLALTALLISIVAVTLAAIELRRRSPGAGVLLFLFASWCVVISSTLLDEWFHTHLPVSLDIAGIRVGFWDLSMFLWIPVIAVKLHSITRRLQDDRERLRGEMQAARHVQEILVPAREIHVPGFQIDASYQPATEVGGDFFQLFPAPGDSLLVVVGDVSGKGMKAALLVSVIVGALQNRKSDQPAEVLRELNVVLLSRSEGGFTTCCCALFRPDGTLTIANAGHLAPYRNGQEIETRPGLPLGVMLDASWEDTRIELQPSDRVVWISDGVVEARNGKRDLLGFERAQALATQAASEIARAAQQFGQDDDITVVSVTRQPVPAYVA